MDSGSILSLFPLPIRRQRLRRSLRQIGPSAATWRPRLPKSVTSVPIRLFSICGIRLYFHIDIANRLIACPLLPSVKFDQNLPSELHRRSHGGSSDFYPVVQIEIGQAERRKHCSPTGFSACGGLCPADFRHARPWSATDPGNIAAHDTSRRYLFLSTSRYRREGSGSVPTKPSRNFKKV